MPYIKQEDRDFLQPELGELIRDITTYYPSSQQPGVINYVITKILKSTNPQCYNDYNTLIGVLECAKLELHRKMVAPYEDKKEAENGEV